jgi:Tfp pilus assembly protein PilV
MLPGMENRTWLIEVLVAACLLAVAIIAFTLMVGHNMWKRALP